jgi:uncharacterized membrane protein YedE/YeeE
MLVKRAAPVNEERYPGAKGFSLIDLRSVPIVSYGARSGRKKDDAVAQAAAKSDAIAQAADKPAPAVAAARPPAPADKPVALLAALAILALALLLQHEFATRQALLFLVGAGLGITLYHAAFGFTGGWRRLIREQRGDGARAQLLLLAASSLLFFPVLGKVFPGIQASAALAPLGLSVLIGAFLFGIGMQLGGGCGSGTLFALGGGHVRMLITLAFFVAGATVGSVHLPVWLALPNLGNLSLIASLGWPTALVLQIAVLAGLYAFVRRLEQRRHGTVRHLAGVPSEAPFVDRLLCGPWPLSWGVIGLSSLGLATLLVAGHPWSITFAFGLWGTKLWQALGGDVGSWSYWGAGYPARALGGSVLADTTSLMDFGIILGAALAAALAGKFAPEEKLPLRSVLAAVLGGVLMGYGARLSFGCNIGALLAGISTGSLHGWLWLGSAFAGNVIGVKLLPYFFGRDRPPARK